MSDRMNPLPFEVLLDWILKEYETHRSIFGIDRSLFYTPKPTVPYAIAELFGQHLATPIGPAAGPHTQLAQNILCAWLSGARFIELKTVQISDELEIPRPCIDMEDEGYNVEWSQELKLDQSAEEYIKAWALIHILRRLLGFEKKAPFGTVFNMSVGYNLEGIQSLRMTQFMDRLEDASSRIAEIQEILQERFPQFADLKIPARIINNVTLSTMHGCPPDEIEQIARYLLVERGLHTTVKLNPTLLGKETVLRILHDDLGFRGIQIPDDVFEHDLQYDRAVELIRSLKEVADKRGLTFGVKLSNTLATANHKGALPGDAMYMSGRALYPITINLFHKLAQQFDGKLNVSYSAGADALNITALLAAGPRPVTVASDLLKPGGYSRFLQYLENLEAEMHTRGATSLENLSSEKLIFLEQAATSALADPRYKKGYHPHGLPKVDSELDLFDCITAPCVEQCAVCQDVPEYAWLIAQGATDQALAVILSRNPLPAVTGYVCTHLCQTRCTRNNYEEPVAIRALKRFAVENGSVTVSSARRSEHKVAIIGSGPSGLAAAYFLSLCGVSVTIYEAKDVAGGMLAIAPEFRLPHAVVERDIARITTLGAKIERSHPITTPPEGLLKAGFDAVYVACGFQKDATLQFEGADAEGVFGALFFLEQVARGKKPDLGSRVLVIGGGNTAMDAARTAQRLTGNPVTVLYRRTRAEMPAEKEELKDLLDEGNLLEELISPKRVIRKDGRVVALDCVRNMLGETDASGRRRPIPIEGSEFQIKADSIIVAIGQRPDVSFLDGSAVSLDARGAIPVDPKTGLADAASVYAGGDAARGPAIIIEACADGRRAAEAICRGFGTPFATVPARLPDLSQEEILQTKRVRARREAQHAPGRLPADKRAGFALIEQSLSEEDAKKEAGRCLQCSTFCDKCVEVCPNRANYTVFVTPVCLSLPVFVCENGGLQTVGKEPFSVTQSRQIIHVDDLCNECGNCATFCVHQGKPYLEKPRLFLDEAAFRSEENNAFFIEGSTVRRREDGRESRLSVEGGILAFEDDHVSLTMSPDFEIQEMSLKKAFSGQHSLREAAEMAVVLDGVKTSLSFLIEEE